MSKAATAEVSVVRAPDGHSIRLTRHEPVGVETPAAVVQVLHGLSEHIGRYDRFAVACGAAGYAFIGHDHRGHGPHAERPGHFADRGGWTKVVGDALMVREFASTRWPDRPIVLFGHSMGSFIAQSVVAREPGHFSGLVLSGSTWSSVAKARGGRWLARIAILLSGGRHASALLHRLGFERFNERFEPARTKVDWLTSDPDEVDRYVADPWCGIPPSNRLWYDLLGGLLEITAFDWLRRIPDELPVLITGGAEDPVGGRGGMARLEEAYKRTGHERVTLKVWPGGRHEMLNEGQREVFTSFVLGWIEQALNSAVGAAHGREAG